MTSFWSRQVWTLTAIVLFGARVGAYAETANFEVWRCAERGGANALYCYLRVLGRECTYRKVVESVARRNKLGHDAEDLIQAAAEFGVRLELRSLTFDDLAALPPPVLTYADGVRPGEGAFLLVQEVTSRQVLFMNGPTATIQKVSQDEFRRVWSGYGLMPAVSVGTELFAGALGFVAATLSFRALVRRRRSR